MIIGRSIYSTLLLALITGMVTMAFTLLDQSHYFYLAIVVFIVFVIMGAILEITAPERSSIIVLILFAYAGIFLGLVVDTFVDAFFRNFQRSIWSVEVMVWWIAASIPLILGILLIRLIRKFKRDKRAVLKTTAVVFLCVGAISLGLWYWVASIKKGDLRLTAPADAEKLSVESLINYVDARKLDLNIDSRSSCIIESALAGTFFHSEHVKMFDRVDSDDWQEKWITYKTALLEKASKANFDTTKLNIFLNTLTPDKRSHILPIAVYSAKQGRKNIWIIVCKWGVPGENYCHVRVYMVNPTSLELIHFSTCK